MLGGGRGARGRGRGGATNGSLDSETSNSNTTGQMSYGQSAVRAGGRGRGYGGSFNSSNFAEKNGANANVEATSYRVSFAGRDGRGGRGRGGFNDPRGVGNPPLYADGNTVSGGRTFLGRGGRGGMCANSNSTNCSNTRLNNENMDSSGIDMGTNTNAIGLSRGNGGRGRGGGRGSSMMGSTSSVPDNEFDSATYQQSAGNRGGGRGRGRGVNRGGSFANSVGVPASDNAQVFIEMTEDKGHRRSYGTGANSTELPPRRNNDYGGDERRGENRASGGRGPSYYVPPVRPCEEIYKEDEENAVFYSGLHEEDEELHIAGIDGEKQEAKAIYDWKDAHLHPILYKNIVEHSKYIHPRKIQSQTIPLILEGKDVKGHSETGSGKTAAYMIPLIQMIKKIKEGGAAESETRKLLFSSKPHPYAIVIMPTRELGIQLYEQGRKLANGLEVSVEKLYGDIDTRKNMAALLRGCDVLCATLGRLRDLVTTRQINLKGLRFLVLDEADELVSDENWVADLEAIFNTPEFPTKEKRQTLLFSATFTERVQTQTDKYLRPNYLMVSNLKLVAANTKISQQFISVAQNHKKELLNVLLSRDLEDARTNNPVDPRPPRTLVFVGTKRDADVVSLFLQSNEIRTNTINADCEQCEREKALLQFRKHEIDVLVATDVCSRGIHISGLDQVINYDLPDDMVTYVHRIGRTGRVKQGQAVSFIDMNRDAELIPDLTKILVKSDQQVPPFFSSEPGSGFEWTPEDGDVVNMSAVGFPSDSASVDAGWD